MFTVVLPVEYVFRWERLMLTAGKIDRGPSVAGGNVSCHSFASFFKLDKMQWSVDRAFYPPSGTPQIVVKRKPLKGSSTYRMCVWFVHFRPAFTPSVLKTVESSSPASLMGAVNRFICADYGFLHNESCEEKGNSCRNKNTPNRNLC